MPAWINILPDGFMYTDVWRWSDGKRTEKSILKFAKAWWVLNIAAIAYKSVVNDSWQLSCTNLCLRDRCEYYNRSESLAGRVPLYLGMFNRSQQLQWQQTRTNAQIGALWLLEDAVAGFRILVGFLEISKHMSILAIPAVTLAVSGMFTCVGAVRRHKDHYKGEMTVVNYVSKTQAT